MRTDEEIEGFLFDLGYVYEKLGDGLWLVHAEDEGVENVVVHHDHPYLTLRVKVMPTPSERREEFFEKLLRLNNTDMVHGAYCLEDDSVVIIDTIQSPNLDPNELQGSIDAIVMALTQHFRPLSEYLPTSDQAA
jgi:hypothetical protein